MTNLGRPADLHQGGGGGSLQVRGAEEQYHQLYILRTKIWSLNDMVEEN